MPQQDGQIAFRNPVKQEGWAQVYHVLTLDQSLSDGSFRLYILLLRYARQKDNCWPGRERLAKDLGKSEPTIERRLAELVDRGLITRQQRGHGKTAVTYIEDVEDIYSSIKSDEARSPIKTDEASPLNNDEAESPIRNEEANPLENDEPWTSSKMMGKQHEERHTYMHDGDGPSTCINTQSLQALQELGVHKTVATRLAAQCDPERVKGWIEYAEQTEGLYNPIGFVVSKLKADEPVPEVSKSADNHKNRYVASCIECYRSVPMSFFCLKCQRCRDHCTCDEPEWGIDPDA